MICKIHDLRFNKSTQTTYAYSITLSLSLSLLHMHTLCTCTYMHEIHVHTLYYVGVLSTFTIRCMCLCRSTWTLSRPAYGGCRLLMTTCSSSTQERSRMSQPTYKWPSILRYCVLYIHKCVTRYDVVLF